METPTDDPRIPEREDNEEQMPDPAEEAAGGSEDIKTGPPNPPDSEEE